MTAAATITVSGPGGNICTEIGIIVNALRAVGYNVVIDDTYYPDEKYDDPVEEKRVAEHARKANTGELNKEIGFDLFLEPRIVVVKANHIPWGG